MPALVLGPLLRYVGETDAIVWVEVDSACTVEVLGARETTFCVCGHHYALVHVTDLRPGTWHAYEVGLNGERVWPPATSEFPPSQFRTLGGERPLHVAWGSCRVAAPHEPPYSLPKDDDERGRGVDALRTLALRMTAEPRERWPDLLVLLGDQVYADEPSPATVAYVETRRNTDETPGERVNDFDEYARLYAESWCDPAIRWLLSTVSSAMIFDDHDVHDDWNISQAWVDEMRATDWWDEHVMSALMSYWIYQHIGNVGPRDGRDRELLASIRRERDGAELLREFAFRADRHTAGSRWSYTRDLGSTRLLVVDSRAGRVLEEERRAMLDEEEWQWLTEQASGAFDHLLIASSLPVLLGRGMHYLEAWSEAVARGGWGDAARPLAERVRQTLDLEHWAAFQDSFAALAELWRAVGAGERGEAPASIVTLSGDVHHAYLYEVAFRRDSGVRSAVWQAVCSPYRNPLNTRERWVIRAAMTRPAVAFARALARSAGVRDPEVRWRDTGGGPWFDNQIAWLTVDGRRLELRLEKAVQVDDRSAELECVLERRLV